MFRARFAGKLREAREMVELKINENVLHSAFTRSAILGNADCHAAPASIQPHLGQNPWCEIGEQAPTMRVYKKLVE